MKETARIHRRTFLKLSAVSGAFLAVGCLPSTGGEPATVNLNLLEDPGQALNAFVFIQPNGKITLYNHRPEMGQGTFQSIPMILAEELEVDINNVNIMQSPANGDKYGRQMVVGSHSIQSSYDMLRKMGAAAREMLVEAAANRWEAAKSECQAKNGKVIHPPGGREMGYGELVEDASKLAAPENPPLKAKKAFRIIGQSIPRRDIPSKTTGEAVFGIDISVPGMLYASIERSPVFLGKVVSYDEERARTVPGVKHVFKTSRHVYGRDREGVAVLADNYWAAEQGRKALNVKWDNMGLEVHSTESIFQDYRKAAGQEGTTLQENGDFKAAFNRGSKKVEAVYETPYQAHAAMEPMNAIVSVEDDKCEFWGSTQNPNGIKGYLSRTYGVPEEKVKVNYTFMGGGFGRRAMTDVVEEAADLSKKSGAPVKAIWTREDDISQGPFRACSLNACKGALDENGNLTALEHKVVCQDIRNQTGENMEAGRSITGGVNTEYEIPDFRLSGVLRKHHVPISYWRSVYHSTNCFAHESFMDELAIAAGKDPIDFRLALLKDHERFTKVLQLVAEKTNWHQPREKNTGKGVAIVERSGAFVAMVVEVARLEGKVKPVKITTAVDCGICIHPDNVKAQTEGSIVMALTAAFKSAITIKEGRTAENNFHNYQMLQLGECPEIETHIIDSADPPEGAGETGLPTAAPALTNAIFDLTGARIRKLPFVLDEV